MCEEPIKNIDLEQKIGKKKLHCDSTVHNKCLAQIRDTVSEKF